MPTFSRLARRTAGLTQEHVRARGKYTKKRLSKLHNSDLRRTAGQQEDVWRTVSPRWLVSNKPGADRGQEGGVPVKDMLEVGAGQRLEGGQDPKRGSLFGDWERSCGAQFDAVAG